MIALAVIVAILIVAPVDPLPPGAVLRLGDPLYRADGPIHYLRYTADGRVLHGWVAGSGGEIRPFAWDAATGARLQPGDCPIAPDLPDNVVPAVRLRGNRVLTAGPGRAGLVWDADTRRQLARLGGHTGEVLAVAASADGKQLATGGAEGLVQLWDAERYLRLPGSRGHTGPVRQVRFSKDGTRALTIGDDRAARVWDLVTGRELRAFAADSAIDLNAAGTGVIVRADGTTAIRDVLTGLEIVPPDQPERSTIIIPATHQDSRSAPDESPDGRVRAQLRINGGIELIETATNEIRRILAQQHRVGRLLAFTPDGTRLLTAGTDHTILVWDVRVQATPLPESIKRETSAAKLWIVMCTGQADKALLAMARFAAEPTAAVKMARLRLKPARSSVDDTAATRLADTRAIELLGAIDTQESRAFLQELAGGEESAWRTREARRALLRSRSGP